MLIRLCRRPLNAKAAILGWDMKIDVTADIRNHNFANSIGYPDESIICGEAKFFRLPKANWNHGRFLCSYETVEK